MAFTYQFLCCLLLDYFLLLPTADARIDFLSTPDTVTPGLSRNLTVRCSFGISVNQSTSGRESKDLACSEVGPHEITSSDESDESPRVTVDNVTSISIAKLGFKSKTIASVVVGQSPHVYMQGTDLQVQGQIMSQSSEEAFLELTWLHPDADLGGSYQCKMTGVNDQGHPTLMFHDLNVNVKETTLNQISDRLWELEETNHKMQSALDLANQQIQSLASAMASLSPPHAEDGEVTCGSSDSDQWTTATVYIPVTPTRVLAFRSGKQFLVPVVFQHPYEFEPAILIAVSSANIEKYTFAVAVQNVTRYGFTIQCNVWSSAIIVGHMNVKWLSTVKGYNQTRFKNLWEDYPESKITWYA